MSIVRLIDFLEIFLCLISIFLWGRFVVTNVLVRHQLAPQRRWISKVTVVMPVLLIVITVVLISGLDLFGLISGFLTLISIGVLLPIYGIFRLREKLANLEQHDKGSSR